jgi:hypothetical protein
MWRKGDSTEVKGRIVITRGKEEWGGEGVVWGWIGYTGGISSKVLPHSKIMVIHNFYYIFYKELEERNLKFPTQRKGKLLGKLKC